MVYDVGKELRERFGDSVGGADHGIFLPSEEISKRKWLAPGRKLEFYDLKNGVFSFFSISGLG